MAGEFDPTEPADALQALGGIGAIVSIALTWVEVSASPGPIQPTTPGYETFYGVLAAVVALVVLVAIVAGLVDQAGGVAILGGVVVAVVAGARFVTLGDGQSAGLGLYLALVAGVVMAVGGVLGRD